MKKKLKKYEDRYAENWERISRNAKRLAKGLCCYPGCENEATQTHHSCYRDSKGNIAGREIAGVHIFPLCERHHSRDFLDKKDNAHNPLNWKQDGKNPVENNRNTTKYYSLLRKGWEEKRWQK